MLKIAKKILFLKDSINMKSDFYEACTHYKMYSKKPPIDTTDELGVCLHVDLFDRENTLSSIGDY